MKNKHLLVVRLTESQYDNLLSKKQINDAQCKKSIDEYDVRVNDISESNSDEEDLDIIFLTVLPTLKKTQELLKILFGDEYTFTYHTLRNKMLKYMINGEPININCAKIYFIPLQDFDKAEMSKASHKFSTMFQHD